MQGWDTLVVSKTSASSLFRFFTTDRTALCWSLWIRLTMVRIQRRIGITRHWPTCKLRLQGDSLAFRFLPTLSYRAF